MIRANIEGLTHTQVEKAINSELEKFCEWFAKEVDEEPLTKVELAILKTYVTYKVALEANKNGDEAPSSPN